MRDTEGRKQAGLAVAYFFEEKCPDSIWPGLRAATRFVASVLGVKEDGRKRGEIAKECSDAIQRSGMVIPKGYVPPWSRVGSKKSATANSAMSKAKRKPKRGRHPLWMEKDRIAKVFKCEDHGTFGPASDVRILVKDGKEMG